MKLPKRIAFVALTIFATAACSLELQPYSVPAFAAAQAGGKPVAVHFHADWCPTCRAQAKVFDSLKSDKTLNITVLVADYDTEKALKKQLGVRVQSTLVVFRGKQETARLAGDTAEAKIRSALQTAL